MEKNHQETNSTEKIVDSLKKDETISKDRTVLDAIHIMNKRKKNIKICSIIATVLSILGIAVVIFFIINLLFRVSKNEKEKEIVCYWTDIDSIKEMDINSVEFCDKIVISVAYQYSEAIITIVEKIKKKYGSSKQFWACIGNCGLTSNFTLCPEIYTQQFQIINESLKIMTTEHTNINYDGLILHLSCNDANKFYLSVWAAVRYIEETNLWNKDTFDIMATRTDLINFYKSNAILPMPSKIKGIHIDKAGSVILYTNKSLYSADISYDIKLIDKIKTSHNNLDIYVNIPTMFPIYKISRNLADKIMNYIYTKNIYIYDSADGILHKKINKSENFYTPLMIKMEINSTTNNDTSSNLDYISNYLYDSGINLNAERFSEKSICDICFKNSVKCNFLLNKEGICEFILIEKYGNTQYLYPLLDLNAQTEIIKNYTRGYFYFTQFDTFYSPFICNGGFLNKFKLNIN